MEGKEQNVVVLCDFDGTITDKDIGFTIIETFAGNGWREIEDQYQRGEKGSREAIQEIFALTSVSESTLVRFVQENFHMDPVFPPFIDYCRKSNIAVTILSDGFDFYIKLILNKYGLDLPYLANTLQVADSSLCASFPYAAAECGSCGNCKAAYARRVKENGGKIIYIGDGYSDRCVSALADVLFAKDYLARYCARENIPYHSFSDFGDILSIFLSGSIQKLIHQEENK